MFHHSASRNERFASRNERPKGFNIKQLLQVALLLGVCIWLLYQIKHSHSKWDESSETNQINIAEQDGIVIFGRKEKAGSTNTIEMEPEDVNSEKAESKEDGGVGDDELDKESVENNEEVALDKEHEESREKEETEETEDDKEDQSETPNEDPDEDKYSKVSMENSTVDGESKLGNVAHDSTEVNGIPSDGNETKSDDAETGFGQKNILNLDSPEGPELENGNLTNSSARKKENDTEKASAIETDKVESKEGNTSEDETGNNEKNRKDAESDINADGETDSISSHDVVSQRKSNEGAETD